MVTELMRGRRGEREGGARACVGVIRIEPGDDRMRSKGNTSEGQKPDSPVVLAPLKSLGTLAQMACARQVAYVRLMRKWRLHTLGYSH
jgi:hypothetical protein